MSNTVEDDGDQSNELIDPKQFLKDLEPDRRGLFEPLSGLMLLNLTDAEFRALADRFAASRCTYADVPVLRTINHETYHFAQAASSGYLFHRQARLFLAFNTVEPVEAEPEFSPAMAALWVAAQYDPEAADLLAKLLAFGKGNALFAAWDTRAAPGDHSLFGAVNPGFFEALRQVAAVEGAPGPGGLSITGLLEGSAVVHTALLMDSSDVWVSIVEELAEMPPVYAELWSLSVDQVGERALELILPATALALRYLRPHMAYPRLLARLAQSASGEALAHGRALSTNLPEIDEAGPALGTAAEVRASDDTYKIYDAVLEPLTQGAWDIDSYDFLADPAAMHKVPMFPMGTILADGYYSPLPHIELVARMAIMSMVLRVRSRRREERDFLRFQMGFVDDLFDQWRGDAPPDAAD